MKMKQTQVVFCGLTARLAMSLHEDVLIKCRLFPGQVLPKSLTNLISYQF